MAFAPAMMLLTMLWYPVQRQRLPSRASRTSCSEGLGLRTAKSSGFAPAAGAAVLSDDRKRFLAPGDDEVGWTARRGRVPLGYLGDRAKTEAVGSGPMMLKGWEPNQYVEWQRNPTYFKKDKRTGMQLPYFDGMRGQSPGDLGRAGEELRAEHERRSGAVDEEVVPLDGGTDEAAERGFACGSCRRLRRRVKDCHVQCPLRRSIRGIRLTSVRTQWDQS